MVKEKEHQRKRQIQKNLLIQLTSPSSRLRHHALCMVPWVRQVFPAIGVFAAD